MVPNFLNIPRTVSKLSNKLRTCSKRCNLITRLSDSVLELIGEEEERGIDKIQREARKYKGLAKKAGILSNVQNTIVNYSIRNQSPTITGEIFEVGYTEEYSKEKLGNVYSFFISNKNIRKREIREAESPSVRAERKKMRIKRVKDNVYALLGEEEKGIIGTRYAKEKARACLRAAKHEGCVNYMRKSLLRHLSQVQTPAITGEVFGISYKINRDNSKMRKMYDFYVQTA